MSQPFKFKYLREIVGLSVLGAMAASMVATCSSQIGNTGRRRSHTF